MSPSCLWVATRISAVTMLFYKINAFSIIFHIRQAMLQLHLSDRQFYCLLRRLDSITCFSTNNPSAQVIACCLTAPRHYLKPCWILIREVPWHLQGNNFTLSAKLPFCIITLKITLLKLLLHFPGVKELNHHISRQGRGHRVRVLVQVHGM